MNNLTVKKADGTTSVVYVAKRSASANTPALYTLDAANTTAVCRPRFSISDKPAAGSRSQKVEIAFAYPVTQVVDGRTVVAATIPVTASFVIPYTVADTDISEAVSQFANLLSAPDILVSIKSGFAPR